MTAQFLTGDCRVVLKTLAEESVSCVVTSPPYFGLRNYGVDGQLGLEPTPEAYVQELVEVFHEVRRTLKNDGTLWLNLGDSYAGSGRGGNPPDSPHQKQATNRGSITVDDYRDFHDNLVDAGAIGRKWVKPPPGLKQKDLIGIPWAVAFALRTDGWFLRQDIIWAKPNPMPESVRDRCTKSHEYLFMLSKSQHYHYDADAIAEPLASTSVERLSQANLAGQHGSDRVPGKTNGPMKAVFKQDGHGRRHAGFNARYFGSDKPYAGQDTKNYEASGAQSPSDTKRRIVARILSGEIITRNRRSVWTITTKPFKGAHFATFPPDLVEPCVLAGCPEDGVVLDPFGGAGTTALVADRLGRDAISIELNPAYTAMAEARLTADRRKRLLERSPLLDL